jgi:hypothetical protein
MPCSDGLSTGLFMHEQSVYLGKSLRKALPANGKEDAQLRAWKTAGF